MSRSSFSWLARMACSLLATIAIGVSAAAQTSSDLFDISALQEIRLKMDSAKWQEFKDRYWEDTYYPADFSWNGITVGNIGIRQRGTGSRSGVKPYIGIDFGQYVKGQQFLGMSALRIKNSINDASFLHERLAMQAMRRMGIPAPREAYARFYVNDAFCGLYVLIEEIDQAFLRRVFGEDAGYLFSYTLGAEYNFEYLGPDPALYSPVMFDPKTRKSDPDVATLIEMIRTINQAPDETFLADVSQYVDIRQFLKQVAVEAFLAEWDGLLGNLGMNNFYMYRRFDTKQFHFIAWDKDETFMESDYSIWRNAQKNVLARRALQVPELRNYYLGALRMTALELGGAGGWLDQEFERAYTQMHEAAIVDNIKPFSNDQFESAAGEVRNFIDARAGFVLGETGLITLPSVSTGGVLNAASFVAGPVAPGGIASIFGSQLADSEMQATELPLPVSMGGTSVRIDGSPVPLFYVSPNQINFQVPWEYEGTATARLTVMVENSESSPTVLRLRPSDPGLFVVNATSGQGAIVIAKSGELAAAKGTTAVSRPAHRGEAVSIYCTGLGPVTNQPPSGEPPAAGILSELIGQLQVTVGGVPAAIAFAGLAPNAAGLYQVNAIVPGAAPTGASVPVSLSIGGTASNAATMAVD